jgi:hypothetical protein
MADNPLGKLGRLLGGVLLTQGRLGHQILGQLLIVNADDVGVAGANVVMAATNGQRNAVAQMALRTAAPALAAHMIARRTEKRLARLSQTVADKQKALNQRATVMNNELAAAHAGRADSERRALDRDAQLAAAAARIAALERDNGRDAQLAAAAAARIAALERDNGRDAQLAAAATRIAALERDNARDAQLAAAAAARIAALERDNVRLRSELAELLVRSRTERWVAPAPEPGVTAPATIEPDAAVPPESPVAPGQAPPAETEPPRGRGKPAGQAKLPSPPRNKPPSKS